MKLPAYKAGLQNNIIINDNSICIPLFGKEGLGEIYKEIIHKIPLNPPFPKGETWKDNFSSPFTKRGIQVHLL